MDNNQVGSLLEIGHLVRIGSHVVDNVFIINLALFAILLRRFRYGLTEIELLHHCFLLVLDEVDSTTHSGKEHHSCVLVSGFLGSMVHVQI